MWSILADEFRLLKQTLWSWQFHWNELILQRNFTLDSFKSWCDHVISLGLVVVVLGAFMGCFMKVAQKSKAYCEKPVLKLSSTQLRAVSRFSQTLFISWLWLWHQSKTSCAVHIYSQWRSVSKMQTQNWTKSVLCQYCELSLCWIYWILMSRMYKMTFKYFECYVDWNTEKDMSIDFKCSPCKIQFDMHCICVTVQQYRGTFSERRLRKHCVSAWQTVRL